MIKPLEDRLWKRIDRKIIPGCWIWTGGLDQVGYGMVYYEGRSQRVHRVVYQLLVGPIPKGFQIGHVHARGCRTYACCNPKHLEAVTPEENKRRKRNTIQQCVNGHPLVGDNIRLNYKGYRICRICWDAAQQRYVTSEKRREVWTRYNHKRSKENAAASKLRV